MAESPQEVPGPLPDEVVYLIGCSIKGLVKIGTSTGLTRRLATIRTHSPVPVELLWWTPGGRALELELHRRLHHKRLHGEWFDFGDDDPVAAVAAALQNDQNYPGRPSATRSKSASRLGGSTAGGPAVRLCECIAWASVGPKDFSVIHTGVRIDYDQTMPFAVREAEADEEGIHASQDLAEVASVAAPDHIASRLGVEVGTELWVCRSRASIDGRVTQLSSAYYPREIAEQLGLLHKSPTASGFRAIESRGYRLARIREELRPRMPTAPESDGLALPPGTPVFELNRTVFADDGMPIEVYSAVVAADLVEFDYEFDIPD